LFSESAGYGDNPRLVVSVTLNLAEVFPVVPVAFMLSICSEPPPGFASPEEETVALSGSPVQATTATETNKPNINRCFLIMNRTAVDCDGF